MIKMEISLNKRKLPSLLRNRTATSDATGVRMHVIGLAPRTWNEKKIIVFLACEIFGESARQRRRVDFG